MGALSVATDEFLWNATSNRILPNRVNKANFEPSLPIRVLTLLVIQQKAQRVLACKPGRKKSLSENLVSKATFKYIFFSFCKQKRRIMALDDLVEMLSKFVMSLKQGILESE